MLYTLEDREAKNETFTFKEIRLDISKISTNPGIYVWKYCPQLSDSNIFEDLSKITNLNFSHTSQFEDSAYKIEVKKKHFKESSNFLGLSSNKEYILSQIIKKSYIEHSEDILKNLMNTIFNNFTPLYIGKASNLRERIKTHVERKSNLLSDIEKIGIDIINEINIETISLKYETKLIKDNENIFEEILQRITSPILSKRYG